MSRAHRSLLPIVACAVALASRHLPIIAAEADRMEFEAAAVVQLIAEPAARLIVDAPLPDQLALGRVVIRYRTEHLKIVPVYGEAALGVSPRIGHLHITVDDGPWRWVDASGQPLIINKLAAGHHKILVELVDPTHKLITGDTVNFEVPVLPAAPAQ
jgi:hypothetical protein